MVKLFKDLGISPIEAKQKLSLFRILIPFWEYLEDGFKQSAIVTTSHHGVSPNGNQLDFILDKRHDKSVSLTLAESTSMRRFWSSIYLEGTVPQDFTVSIELPCTAPIRVSAYTLHTDTYTVGTVHHPSGQIPSGRVSRS